MGLAFKEHRYLKNIDNGISKGINQFFLYGKGLNDYALFDVYLGIKELRNSLFLYFINICNVDAFVEISSNKVKVFDTNDKEISINDICKKEKKRGGFGANKNQVGSSTNTKIEKVARDAIGNQNSFDNDIDILEKKIDEFKLAIFIKDLEWEANLYGAEPKLDLLKKIKNFAKSKHSFTIISIKEPKLLENFGYDVDEEQENLVYIGNPSQTELLRAYKRYIYTIRDDIKIIEKDFEDIISGIQASKRSLRESIRILKDILKPLPKNTSLTKELFKNSITNSIEEKITFDNVILDEKTKKEIIGIVKTFHTDKENSLKGIILKGPPGTGKTYIAKAIANEFKMNFIAPTLSDLKGEFVGQTSVKIQRIFEEARANSPTIMFLDEIDTIFLKRDGNSDSYVKDMVNQFLVEIDGATTGKQEIFIIGATNRIEVIDSAIRSRLKKEFEISLPDEQNRLKIFDSKFTNFKLSSQSWHKEFIRKTEGMSGRDIDNFIKSIKRHLKNQDESNITENNFRTELLNFVQNFILDFKQELSNSIEIKDNNLITFDDIIGYDEVKESLKRELNYILSSNEAKKQMKMFHIKPKRGTLLYGPPGNGKTTFAEALAGENDFYYIKVLSKDFTSSLVEETIDKLKIIFDNTIKLSKMMDKKGIVLFFDEIDSLIGKANLSPAVRGTLLNLLEDKNGIKHPDSKIILVAATNYKEFLDEASIREGRFDNKLEIRYPNDDEAIEMLKGFFKNDKDLDISYLDDSFFNELYSNLKEEKQKEIENENLKIKDERFYKEFQGIPTVELKGLKEHLKAKAFYNSNIRNNKIIIELKG